MARPSYMSEVARRAHAGVPALAPPRTLFRRWGTVAPAPEIQSAPSTRTTAAQSNTPRVNRDKDVDVVSADPIGAQDAVRFRSKLAITEHVQRAVTPDDAAASAPVQTPQRSAPPARSIHPQAEPSFSFSAPPTAVAPALFRAPQPGIQLPIAQLAAPPIHERTATSIPAPAAQKITGEHPAPRTRSDFPSTSPSPLRSAPNHRPAAPAPTVAMPTAPHERAPLTALPPAERGNAPSGPVIRIGSVEVQIVPAVPSPPARTRPAATASPAAPLSREMISLFGLRQG